MAIPELSIDQFLDGPAGSSDNGANEDFNSDSSPTGNASVSGAYGAYSVLQFLADQASLDQSGVGFSIVDSAANVGAYFDQLNADPNITAITLTDAGGPALSLSVAQALGTS